MKNAALMVITALVMTTTCFSGLIFKKLFFFGISFSF
jgi:hypothetical protein